MKSKAKKALKNVRNLTVLVIAIIFAFPANGQTCTCESNFEWVKKTFEENDAGFQHIIDKKGNAAYDTHNQLIVEKIKATKTLTECTELLYEWLKFFRTGHVWIECLTNEAPVPQSLPQKNEGVHLEDLNATTLYLRISSFDMNEKHAIDNVITANKDKILKTENLIIDLRDNSGGAGVSFAELLPFLYTNPVRMANMEFLSTKANNQFFLDLSTSTEYEFPEEMRQEIRRIAEKMQGRLGEFVNPDNEAISISRRDTVYEYPKNVGIIINEKNASITELFLLVAKQSKKVKLFGVTTSGALDLSNMLFIESPCKEFRLHYCMSRSLRIPDMAMDDIGIQPDFYLDKSIPQYKWVEFVNDVLNQ